VTIDGLGGIKTDLSNAPVALLNGSNWDFEAGTTVGWTNITSVDSSEAEASAGKKGVVTVHTNRTYPGKIPVNVNRTYQVRARVKSSVAKQVSVGVMCYDKDGLELIGTSPSPVVRSDCAASNVNLAANVWTTLEGVISGEQLTNLATNNRFTFMKSATTTLTTAYAAPYIVGAVAAGVLNVDFIELTDITETWAQSPDIRPHDSDLGMAYGPGYAVKAHAVDGWNAGVRSRTAIIGGFRLSFSPNKVNKSLVIGVTGATSNVDAGYAAFNVAFFVDYLGVVRASESNVLTNLGTYVAGDVLAIAYDGVNVRYIKNSTVLRTIGPLGIAASTSAYYLDSSFYHQGAAVSNLQFFAAGVSGLGGIAMVDQITAANASTYIANLAVNSLQIAGNAVTVNYSATLATASSISINSYNSATYSLEFSGAYTVMESSVFNNVGQGVLAIANGGVMLDNFTAKPYLNLHLYVVPTNSSGTPTSAGSCYPSASLTVVWDAATLLSIAQYVIQASVVPPSGYFKIVLGASQWAGPVAGTPTVYFEGHTGAGSAFNPSTTLSVIGTKK
jgi:hypothetical protein